MYSRLVWLGAGRFPVQPLQCSPVIAGCHVIRCHRRSRPGWRGGLIPTGLASCNPIGAGGKGDRVTGCHRPGDGGAGRSPRHPIHLAARSPPGQSPNVTGCHQMSGCTDRADYLPCHELSRLAIGGLTDRVKWVEGDCDRS